ncbi:cupin domain-containing protein [Candidatus Latescibacterota bacterium]
MKNSILTSLVMLFALYVSADGQNLDGRSYRPGVDPNIDMYMASWQESMPRHTHGSLIERDILTRGDPMKPPTKGAVLKYVNRFTHATLAPGDVTTPTTLEGEQEIMYILSGRGTVEAGGRASNLYPDVCILIPANLEFTITAGDKESLTMYLVSEPVPVGFVPEKEIQVIDVNREPIRSTTGHWCHIVKDIFNTQESYNPRVVKLGTLERVLTVALDPMTIAHPHSHGAGVEEVWAAVSGTSIAFIGKQIRMQPPGTAYMIPPDGNTPHANINTSDKQVKFFYFARYGE